MVQGLTAADTPTIRLDATPSGLVCIRRHTTTTTVLRPFFPDHPLTVKHRLVECANLRDIREKYFTVSSVADLFNRVDNHTVIVFIKETHFYHQL